MTTLKKQLFGIALTIALSCAPLFTAHAQEEAEKKLGSAELEQMLAPIALYPDELLSQVLIASTYPLEVVEADRWAQGHKDLKGDALGSALGKQEWDDSVKALAQTPDVLATMSKNLDWTQNLGDAVLAQQEDVMNSVQRLRAKAYAEKNLTSNDQQKVEVQQQGDDQTIIIQSATPNTVYVPYYQPATVYGAWGYPSYPPVYYPPPPGYGIAEGIAEGIGFAAGVAIMDDIWDSDFDWGHDDINVNVDNSKHVDIDRNKINNNTNANTNVRPGANGGGTQWKHDPGHRHGVAYKNGDLERNFAPKRAASKEASGKMREDLRGQLNRTGLNNAGTLNKTQIPHAASQASGALGNRMSDMHRSDARAAATGRASLGGVTQRDRTNRAQGARESSAFSNIGDGRRTSAESARGRASVQHSSVSPQRSGGNFQRSGGGFQGHGGGGRRR